MQCGGRTDSVVLLRAWRRVYSSLTDEFHPVRDTYGTALQVLPDVHNALDQAAHKLGALLRALQRDGETLLFHVAEKRDDADNRCRCWWPASSVFALSVADDLSACWLLPHISAEQVVLCDELEDERLLFDVGCGAQAVPVRLRCAPRSGAATFDRWAVQPHTVLQRLDGVRHIHTGQSRSCHQHATPNTATRHCAAQSRSIGANPGRRFEYDLST